MSSDFHWRAWLQTLHRLENLVELDLYYQTSKAHDQKRCDAAQRLTGVLGEYCAIYTNLIESLRQNLQVQKTMYMAAVVKAVVARIVEIKQQLQKLESTNIPAFGQGLVARKITPYDVEIKELPDKPERPERLEMIKQVFREAEEKKEELERLAEEEKERQLQEEQENENALKVWDNETQDTSGKSKLGDAFSEIYAVEKKISEETLKRRQIIAVIQAHERTRQVTRQVIQSCRKRELWTKALAGTLNPAAREEIKQRSASLIQKVCRAYFESKRKKIVICKRDELLGIRLCQLPMSGIQKKVEKNEVRREDLGQKIEREWTEICAKLKKTYARRRGDDIAEDFRDELRDWFLQWYKEVIYFYDIPAEKQGGSALILKEEVPTPSEWSAEYKQHMENKNKNKGKTALQLKLEKKGAKNEASSLKREQRLKERMEEKLLKNLMKNPKNHPGFQYPESKKTEHVLQAIEDYHDNWDELDNCGSLDVKEGSVRAIDIEKICMEVKIEIRRQIDVQMREELKKLNKALAQDYMMNNEKMPEPMKKSGKKTKKKNKAKLIILNSTIDEKMLGTMEDLIEEGILKEYPKTKFQDFHGDYNFAENELRCQLKPAQGFGGETRNLWWDQCLETLRGFNRILLVGPKGSGKTTLMHALASNIGAVLLELDPEKLAGELISDVYLENIIQLVANCAKAIQPAVIFVRHVHRLFYKKVPPSEANLNLDLIKNHVIKKLFKRIQKTDKVTIIGTCVEPWRAKNNPMLKKFPAVVLLPNTNYSCVVQLLHRWILNNREVPRDFSIHSLSYVLQGYPYDFLKKCMDEFLTAERIVRIAAHGLSQQEIYEYIVQHDEEAKTDYIKYLQWYWSKTPWGKKEMKLMKEQLEFKAVMEKWEQKMEEKKKKRMNKGNKTDQRAVEVQDSGEEVGTEEGGKEEETMNKGNKTGERAVGVNGSDGEVGTKDGGIEEETNE